MGISCLLFLLLIIPESQAQRAGAAAACDGQDNQYTHVRGLRTPGNAPLFTPMPAANSNAQAASQFRAAMEVPGANPASFFTVTNAAGNNPQTVGGRFCPTCPTPTEGCEVKFKKKPAVHARQNGGTYGARFKSSGSPGDKIVWDCAACDPVLVNDTVKQTNPALNSNTSGGSEDGSDDAGEDSGEEGGSSGEGDAAEEAPAICGATNSTSASISTTAQTDQNWIRVKGASSKSNAKSTWKTAVANDNGSSQYGGTK